MKGVVTSAGADKKKMEAMTAPAMIKEAIIIVDKFDESIFFISTPHSNMK